VKNNHIPNGFRGLLASLASVLAFIMFHALCARIFSVHPETGAKGAYFLKIMFPALILSGIPAGIVYGICREKTPRTREFEQKGRFRFWTRFWGTLLIAAIGSALFLGPGKPDLLALPFSLLVFSGIWTFLIEVITENPLSFAHLMPENTPPEDTPLKSQASSALIKKRRG